MNCVEDQEYLAFEKIKKTQKIFSRQKIHGKKKIENPIKL